jgi:hypothetical protein
VLGDELTARQWPGNIREPQNVIERAVTLAHGSVLDLSISNLQASPPCRFGLRVASRRATALADLRLRFVGDRPLLVSLRPLLVCFRRPFMGAPGAAPETDVLGARPSSLAVYPVLPHDRRRRDGNVVPWTLSSARTLYP